VEGLKKCGVPTLPLTKNPGLFQNPHEKFSRTFWSPRMLKYKEKPSPLLLTSDGKIDSNRFSRPNRFELIHIAES